MQRRVKFVGAGARPGRRNSPADRPRPDRFSQVAGVGALRGETPMLQSRLARTAICFFAVGACLTGVNVLFAEQTITPSARVQAEAPRSPARPLATRPLQLLSIREPGMDGASVRHVCSGPAEPTNRPAARRRTPRTICVHQDGLGMTTSTTPLEVPHLSTSSVPGFDSTGRPDSAGGDQRGSDVRRSLLAIDAVSPISSMNHTSRRS